MEIKWIVQIIGIGILASLLSGCAVSLPAKKATPPVSVERVVYYYLPQNSDAKSFDKRLVPAGSLVIGECGYLTLTKGETILTDNANYEMVTAALAKVLRAAGTNTLYNPVTKYGTLTFKLDTSVSPIKILFSGKLPVTDRCERQRIGGMLEQTIYQNIPKPTVEILYNGSDSYLGLFQ